VRSQRLVHSKKDAHERNNLRQAGAESSEVSLKPLLPADPEDGFPQVGVHAIISLRGKTGAEEI